MKIIFFDTETTGLDHQVHGIHQLAGEIVKNGEVVKSFEFKMNPFKGHEIDMRALEVSNTSKTDISRYTKEECAFAPIKYMLEKYIEPNERYFLAGWRAPEFDCKFLQALFQRNNSLNEYRSLFWNNPIDVKTLATQHIINQRTEMASFSLVAVAKHLGIEVDEAKLHSAAYDAYLSRRIYEIVTL